MLEVKKQSSLITILAICALFIALLSFLLPYVSINFLGTHTISGIDFIGEAVDNEELPAMLAVLCPILSIIGLICAFSAMKLNNASIGTLISSAVGMIIMIVAMSDENWDIIVAIDYAAVGFYLYEIMSFAAIVLSAASIYLTKNAVTTGDGTFSPMSKLTHKPAPAPLAKVICPACKREQAQDAAYCRFCGTEILRTASTRVSNPPPVDVVDWISKPGKSAAVEKTERKAICPYCGARQREDAVRCKYCGTSMKQL